MAPPVMAGQARRPGLPAALTFRFFIKVALSSSARRLPTKSLTSIVATAALRRSFRRSLRRRHIRRRLLRSWCPRCGLPAHRQCSSRGSARIERLPSARVPNSARPRAHPTRFSTASRRAVTGMVCLGDKRRSRSSQAAIGPKTSVRSDDPRSGDSGAWINPPQTKPMVQA